jgi:hypothetical protein
MNYSITLPLIFLNLILWNPMLGQFTDSLQYPDNGGCKFIYDSISGQNVVFESDSMPIFDFQKYSVQGYIHKKSKEDSSYYSSWEVLPGQRLEMVLTFIIDQNGRPSCFRVRGSPRPDYWEKRTIEILENGPKWQPAKCAEKNVPSINYLNIQIFWQGN